MNTYTKHIAKTLNLPERNVDATLTLLKEGCTIPFIARYRKERTGNLDELQITHIAEMNVRLIEIDKRKDTILRTIGEQGKLTNDLENKIADCWDNTVLEDLYLPFKPKRRTKAQIAREQGLESLAMLLLMQKEQNPIVASKRFVRGNVDNEIAALQGAKDIIAEEVSDHADLRSDLKSFEEQHALLETKATKTFEENGVYKIYQNYSKKLFDMPSYAYLAVSRAEKEKQLSVKLQFSQEKILAFSAQYFIPKNANTSVVYLQEAVDDGLSRLLLPSLERELRGDKKRRADESAIKVFGENLKQLLLTPPVQGLTVLGFDPAFRTGCKLAIVDKT